ncbi:phosphatase PAP2 family protein [Abditibacterium utsteinense]|nr:phosphatase PAP2 family protein [Abditibacterium utsteinense]
MSYQQLDKIADLCDPLLIIGLLVAAFLLRRGAAWPFVLKSALAVVVVQQLSKYCQKHDVLGGGFPSTHFAVALALLTCFVILKRNLWPYALGFALFYATLMLAQHYHTPLQMLGSLFAIPLALLFHWKPRKTRSVSN